MEYWRRARQRGLDERGQGGGAVVEEGGQQQQRTAKRRRHGRPPLSPAAMGSNDANGSRGRAATYAHIQAGTASNYQAGWRTRRCARRDLPVVEAAQRARRLERRRSAFLRCASLTLALPAPRQTFACTQEHHLYVHETTTAHKQHRRTQTERKAPPIAAELRNDGVVPLDRREFHDVNYQCKGDGC